MSHIHRAVGATKPWFLPALVFALLSSDVHAGAATASGSFCRPLEPGTYEYRNFSFANLGSDGLTVSCTIPMDDVALGSTVTYRMRVEDKSTTAGFSCVPYVTDENASQLASGATRTTGTSQTGWFTLAKNIFNVDWTASVPGTNVNTNIYAIQCEMPGNGSVIFTARAQ